MLNTTQAAAILGITRDGVVKLIRRGTLKASKFGPMWAIDPADLDRARQRPGPGRPKREDTHDE